MNLYTHLVRRDGVFYWRRRVPHDLRQLWGRAQIIKSLFTGDRHCAYRTSRRLDVAMDMIFDMARSMPLTTEQLQTLTNEVIRLERDQLEHERTVFTGLTTDKARRASEFSTDMCAAMKTHLMTNDFSTVAPFMRDVLDRHMPDVPTDSYEWRQFGRSSLRALAQTYDEDAMHWLGEFESDKSVPLPASPAWTTSPPSSVALASTAPAPAPVRTTAEKTISTYVERYVEHFRHAGLWTNQTEAQNRNSIDLLIRICGDKPPSAYTRSDAERLRRQLEKIPENYGKSPRHKAMTIDDVIASKKPDTKTLSVTTLNRHWNSITGYFRWVERLDDVPDLRLDRIFKGFHWSADAPEAQERIPWDTPSLEKLFASPIWTGCKMHPEKRYWRHLPGHDIVRDEYYWLPIAALFSGARCDELGNLTGRDVFQLDGVWVMHLHGEHLKTPESERLVPIHSTLIALGFLDLATRAGSNRLFSHMIPGGRDDKYSHFYTEHFTDYRRRIGVYRELMDFHSFRTNATSALVHNGVPLLVADEITGHDSVQRKEAKEMQTTTLRYVSIFPMQKLKEAVEIIAYPTIDWSRFYPASCC